MPSRFKAKKFKLAIGAEETKANILVFKLRLLKVIKSGSFFFNRQRIE